MNASNGSTSAIDKAANAVHTAIDDAARKARAPVDRMTEIAHDASDRAVAAKAQAADWLSEKGDRIAAPSRKLIADTSSYVSANPLKSLGIAVVAALLVGRLMR
jgi:ElaB/YqjD/DUF883 family membrane-anchored ribosome-binding protein